MSDRISSYQSVRLVVHVPQTGSRLAPWSLTAVVVKKGVPRAVVLDRGLIPLEGPSPSHQAIVRALDGVVGPMVVQ
jgi:hypothetical protein